MDVENNALVSLTDNSSSTPGWVSLYDPSAIASLTNYPSLFGDTDGVTSETDRTNNTDNAEFRVLSTIECV